MTRRDANESLPEGATLAAVGAALRIRRQTVLRLQQRALRKLWRRQVALRRGMAKEA